MDDALQRFFGMAFERVPAREANDAIQRVRDSLGGTPAVRSYEVVAAPEPEPAWFQATLLPRLVYHLESLAIRPPAPGLFLSVFVGEELLFIHARDALALGAELLGVSQEELYARFGTGEVRTALRDVVPERKPGPPLALPGPESKE